MSDAHRVTDTAVRVPTVARRMGDAARRWLDALTDAQRKVAVFPFGSDERFVWDYRPVPHKGLALQDMNEAQRDAAAALLDEGLSTRGAAEARAIMALEPILGEIEPWPGAPIGRGANRCCTGSRCSVNPVDASRGRGASAVTTWRCT